MVETLTLILLPVYAITLFFAFVMLVRIAEGFHEKKRNVILKTVPFVTIAIPAVNEQEYLETTVLSALNLNYPKEKFEIIIVNDGSTDNTRNIAENLVQKYPGRVYLINQKNSGKARSLNTVLSRAKGEFFVCLDADSYVEKTTLKRQIQLFYDKGLSVGIVTPVMLAHKPKKFIEMLQSIEYLLGSYFQNVLGNMDCMFVAPGPFSVYRTKVLRKLGGYSLSTVTEDLEVTFRFQQAGYRVQQCPDAIVTTSVPSSWKALFLQRKRWLFGALQCFVQYKKMFFNKKYGDFGVFQLPTNIISYVLALLAFSLFLYAEIKWIHSWWLTLIASNFDILTIIKSSNFSINWYSVNPLSVILFLTMILIVSITLLYAHDHANTKVQLKTLFYFIPFILFYYLFSAIVIISLLPTALKREKGWW